MMLNSNMKIESPLLSWVNREESLPNRFIENNITDTPNKPNQWSVWISIEEMKPLHQVNEMHWQSLIKTRKLTNAYLKNASSLINGLSGGWLDNEERIMILDELGEPPIPCYPIYFITCSDNQNENVVYVGKTNNINRFTGGHTAALKLHDPKFAGNKKLIYRGCVWFYLNNEYISLDWIQPEELAHELIESIESQLIYYFQPELNTQKKKRNYAKWIFSIHIQNFLNRNFLHDTLILN